MLNTRQYMSKDLSENIAVNLLVGQAWSRCSTFQDKKDCQASSGISSAKEKGHDISPVRSIDFGEQALVTGYSVLLIA